MGVLFGSLSRKIDLAISPASAMQMPNAITGGVGHAAGLHRIAPTLPERPYGSRRIELLAGYVF